MPQDTRPRTVTPQNQPMTPPDNGLADILSRAGVVPFNPNTGGSPDLNSVIQSLLTPQPAPAPQQQGLLQSILSSLPGVAAAATGNPILAQQAQQQQAQKFAQQQAEREQSDRMNQIRQQFGLKLIDSQLGEQQDIAKEARTSAYKKEERIAAEAAAIRQFNLEQTGEETKQKWNHQNQLDILNIKRLWDKEDQAHADTKFAAKEKQDLLEKKLDVQLGMVRSGLPIGIASSVVDKWFSGEKLTPAEEKALTATAQRALRLASGGGRGSGGSSSKSDKMYEQVITEGGIDGESGSVTYKLAPSGMTKTQAVQITNQYMQKPLVLLRDGSIVDRRNIPDKDILLDAVRIDHELTPEEKRDYIKQRVLPSVMDAMMPNIPKQKEQARPFNPNDFENKAKAFVGESNYKAGAIPTAMQKAQYYQEQFNKAVGSGDYTPEGVAKSMLQMSQQLPPEDRMIVEGIVVRNTKNKANNNSTKTKAQIKGTPKQTPEQMKQQAQEFLRKGAQ